METCNCKCHKASKVTITVLYQTSSCPDQAVHYEKLGVQGVVFGKEGWDKVGEGRQGFGNHHSLNSFSLQCRELLILGPVLDVEEKPEQLCGEGGVFVFEMRGSQARD